MKKNFGLTSYSSFFWAETSYSFCIKQKNKYLQRHRKRIYNRIYTILVPLTRVHTGHPTTYLGYCHGKNMYMCRNQFSRTPFLCFSLLLSSQSLRTSVKCQKRGPIAISLGSVNGHCKVPIMKLLYIYFILDFWSIL